MNDLINKMKLLRYVNINNNVMHRHKIAGGKWFIKPAYSIALFTCSKDLYMQSYRLTAFY